MKRFQRMDRDISFYHWHLLPPNSLSAYWPFPTLWPYSPPPMPWALPEPPCWPQPLHTQKPHSFSSASPGRKPGAAVLSGGHWGPGKPRCRATGCKPGKPWLSHEGHSLMWRLDEGRLQSGIIEKSKAFILAKTRSYCDPISYSVLDIKCPSLLIINSSSKGTVISCNHSIGADWRNTSICIALCLLIVTTVAHNQSAILTIFEFFCHG